MPDRSENELEGGLLLSRQPIRKVKLYEIVVAKIEELIQSGTLKPGDELPAEREIMAAFNVGRPAVREALLALQNKGMITIENGRRARVRVPSVENVIDTLSGIVPLMIKRTGTLKNLFDLRIFVEAAMARQAASAITAAQVSKLEEALVENRQAISDRERFMETDAAFHAVLFHTADNPVFDAVHSALVSWIMDRWREIERDEQTERAAYHGHLQVFKAVSRRDPNAAEQAIRKHLENSWKTWEKQLGAC
jgi:GntR family transcriptional regulator, sialic acid-inducible nan operon repressor